MGKKKKTIYKYIIQKAKFKTSRKSLLGRASVDQQWHDTFISLSPAVNQYEVDMICKGGVTGVRRPGQNPFPLQCEILRFTARTFWLVLWPFFHTPLCFGWNRNTNTRFITKGNKHFSHNRQDYIWTGRCVPVNRVCLSLCGVLNIWFVKEFLDS